jgi:hypothetical protein
MMDLPISDNLMRGLIATSNNYNLGAMWVPVLHYPPTGDPNYFEQTALGESLVSGIVQIVNDPSDTYMSWIGDPTLRIRSSHLS